MADWKKNASRCAVVTFLEAVPCKLPLLDGQTGESPEIITAEVELDNASKIHEVCRHDRSLFHGMVCVSWALVLRCYTGQDQVTFQYSGDRDAIASLLQVIFDDGEILSKYADEARAAITCMEQKREASAADAANANADANASAVLAKSNEIPNSVNTAVCIWDRDQPRTLGAKPAARTISQVSRGIPVSSSIPNIFTICPED